MIIPKEIISHKHKDYSDDIFEGEEIFSSNNYYYKDNLLVIIKDKKKYIFKEFNSDILYACSNLTKYVLKGDKFYCCSYEISKGVRLSGGNWKENKKEGKWYYRGKNEFSILTYRNGKIIKKEKILENKSKIPYYRVYPRP